MKATRCCTRPGSCPGYVLSRKSGTPRMCSDSTIPSLCPEYSLYHRTPRDKEPCRTTNEVIGEVHRGVHGRPTLFYIYSRGDVPYIQRTICILVFPLLIGKDRVRIHPQFCHLLRASHISFITISHKPQSTELGCSRST